jgi:hypothetical protein
MKIIFFVIPLTILILQCNPDKCKINNFNDEFNEISELDKKINLVVFSSTKLEESNEVIIQYITNLSIRGKMNQILVSDMTSNISVLYNLQNGKFINYYRGTREIADSIARSGVLPAPFEMLHGKKARYVPIQELQKDIKEEKLKENILNFNYSCSVMGAKYTEDSIIIICQVMCFARTEDTTRRSRFVANLPTLLIFDTSLVLRRVRPIVQNTQDFNIEGHATTTPNDFIYKENTKEFIITAYDGINKRANSMFKLTSLNKYNSNCNKFSVIAYLPNEYLECKLGYNIDYQPQLLKSSDRIFCCYPYSKNIYEITDKQTTAFCLSNLPNYNDEGISFLKNIQNVDKWKNKGYLNAENIMKLFPLRIWKLFNIGNNLGVFLTIRKEISNHNFEQMFFIQEYTKDGKLVHFAKIVEEDNNGLISNIDFDNVNKELILFRKHNLKGWTMEKAKWL